MSALVIYDSLYGNTARIATVIAATLNIDAKYVQNTTLSDIDAADLIILGSPTQGGMPTKHMQGFLKSLSEEAIIDKRVATFDTRFLPEEHSRALRVLMKIVSYAAPRMDEMLRKKGAKPVVEPEGFFVHDTKGDLNEGEVERAKSWADKLININGELR